MCGGVSLHLFLVLLQFGFRLGERLGLFAQLFDKRLMGFDLFTDGHLPFRESAAPLEALGGKDVGASDGLVFLFELPDVMQVLIDRVIDLIEPLLDLRRHLREAGIHRRTALNGGPTGPSEVCRIPVCRGEPCIRPTWRYLRGRMIIQWG